MHHLLTGLAGLVYLGTQGKTSPPPAYHGVESNGAWGASNASRLRSDFMMECTMLPAVIGTAYTQGCDFSNLTWPAEIWGWRVRNPQTKYNIAYYALANNCNVTDLCYRKALGAFYVKYGIEMYTGVTLLDVKKSIVRYYDDLSREVRDRWFTMALNPSQDNPNIAVDRWGEEWYYVSKEWVFNNILVPKRRLLVEKRQEQLQP